MEGTPYRVTSAPFLSPLGVPCQQPPFGTLTAIDLKTRKVIWRRPIGTTQDTGPLGLRSGLALPMGMPNMGGSITTAGGVTFIAATLDANLRAFDTASGAELWRHRLPAGGQATPMTYASRSGRQFVVIAAGGNAVLGSRTGDHVVAFALPASGRGASQGN
jgi:glucose dehydrogenase